MLVQRVKSIISAKNLTASRFADHIGVPRSTISHILSGRNNPSLELIQKILDHFPEVRTEWLVRGKGPMTTGIQSLFPDEAENSGEPDDTHRGLTRDGGSDTRHRRSSHPDQGGETPTVPGNQSNSPGAPHNLSEAPSGPMKESEYTGVKTPGSKAGHHESPEDSSGISAIGKTSSQGPEPFDQTSGNRLATARSGEAQNDIDRIIVFYKDGTFNTYMPR